MRGSPAQQRCIPSLLLDKHLVTALNSLETDSVPIDNLLDDKQKIPLFALTDKPKFQFIDDSSNSAHLTSNLQMPLTPEHAPIFATFGYKDPRFYIALKIKNKQVMALVDSGSTKTYMGDSAANLIGGFKETTAYMTAANNNTVPVDGIRLID